MKYLALVLAGISLTWTAFAGPFARAGNQEAPVAAEPASKSEVTPLVSNVQFIGASITAGFGNAKELKLGSNTPLAKFLGAAWADRNQGAKFAGAGSNGFFLTPQTTGSSQVAKALASSPTLVIALDFLFWYGFGNVQPSTPRRAAGLAQGLKELEAFECPLIIGTLPNVDHALKGVGPMGGPVIFPSQIPTESARKAMNETILAWAAAREHVQVVDVEGILASLVAGEALTLRGQTQKSPGLTSSLQKDLLHLNLEGYVWTALALCDAAAKFDGAEADDFIFDAAKIRARFLASIADAQAKQAERTAKRLAREAARKAARGNRDQ
jgi:hypothetical protein